MERRGELDRVDVGRGVARVESDRAVESGEGLVQRDLPAQVQVDLAERVPGVGVIGIAAHGLARGAGQPPVPGPGARRAGHEHRVDRHQQAVARREAVVERARPERERMSQGVAAGALPAHHPPEPPDGQGEVAVERHRALIAGGGRVPGRPAEPLLALEERLERRRRR